MISSSKTHKKLVKNEFLQTLNSKKLKNLKYLSLKLKNTRKNTQNISSFTPSFRFKFWVQPQIELNQK